MRQHEGLDPRLLCDTVDILDRRVVGFHVRHETAAIAMALVPQPRRPHYDLEEYPRRPQFHRSGRPLGLGQVDQLIHGQAMVHLVAGAFRTARWIA